jgi:hypothetical protein
MLYFNRLVTKLKGKTFMPCQKDSFVFKNGLLLGKKPMAVFRAKC